MTLLLSQKVEKIVEVLLPVSPTSALMSELGVPLFFFYYHQFNQEEHYLSKAISDLEKIIESFGKGHTSPTFSNGVAGIGWLIEFLEQKGFIESDTNELLAAIDEPLQKVMMHHIRSGNFDYLHGALGMGLYFLKREKKNPSVRNYLINLVQHLDYLAIKENGSIKWDKQSYEGNAIETNLGLSHGIPSILVFLLKTYQIGILPEISENLAKGAVKFIMQCTLDINEHSSYFPTFFYKEDKQFTSSRLAWCYGDLGVCCALWQAAEVFNDVLLKDKVIEILLYNSQRRDLKETKVLDTGLCHGTSGIAYIFWRMYQRTNIEIFKETADFWYEKTLQMAYHEHGSAGFKAYNPPREIWEDKKGFLEGVAGIGLALLTRYSEQESSWEEMLLI